MSTVKYNPLNALPNDVEVLKKIIAEQSQVLADKDACIDQQHNIIQLKQQRIT